MDKKKFLAWIAAASFADDFNVLFKDAIEYHRQKVNLPTTSYRDIEGRAHDRSFVVAGVTKEDMLADINKAVDDALVKGETLEQFTKKFDDIATRNGWLADQTEKARAWRARVIYETNLRTAQQAGRRKQMLDPEVLKVRPFWQYVHADTREPKVPRPLHLSWDGIVLRYDNDWWDAHYGPNGWLCTCGVRSLSYNDLKRMGRDGPDATPNDGIYQDVNPVTGEVTQIPNGIDPGWDHAPGKDWIDGLTPKLDTAPGNAPAPSLKKSVVAAMIAAARKFLARFFKSSSAELADGMPDDMNVVFTDVVGAPLALSTRMFQNGKGEWLGSPALWAALPGIADALIDPDEIRLIWAGGKRKVLTRLYIRGSLIVRWNKSVWSWSKDEMPDGGVSIYTRGQ